MYAVCHYIPLSHDEDGGDALVIVASFVIEVLNYQPRVLSEYTAPPAELFMREMTMLQSGCVQFLAIVVGALSTRNAEAIATTKTAAGS